MKRLSSRQGGQKFRLKSSSSQNSWLERWSIGSQITSSSWPVEIKSAVLLNPLRRVPTIQLSTNKNAIGHGHFYPLENILGYIQDKRGAQRVLISLKILRLVISASTSRTSSCFLQVSSVQVLTRRKETVHLNFSCGI
jgi:hypothetical protein